MTGGSRGRARADGPQLRRGHERRDRLRPRRGRLRSPRAAISSSSASRRSTQTTSGSCSSCSRSTQSAPARRSPRGCSRTGSPARVREGDPARLQARARRARRRGALPRPSRSRPAAPASSPRNRRRPPDGKDRRLPERSAARRRRSAPPAERIGDVREFVGTLPLAELREQGARAAWSAACRSATAAARSAT